MCCGEALASWGKLRLMALAEGETGIAGGDSVGDEGILATLLGGVAQETRQDANMRNSALYLARLKWAMLCSIALCLTNHGITRWQRKSNPTSELNLIFLQHRVTS
jgi:hypothetical protein